MRHLTALLLLAITPLPALAQPSPPAAGAASLLSAAVEVADMAKAKRFYMGVLGMKPVFTSGKPGDAREELGLSFSGNPRAAETMVLLVHSAGAAPQGPRPSLVFRVPDARAMIERARAGGFAIVGEVTPLPGAPFVRGMTRDSEGALIELLQPLAPR